ncbi:hypothetical protein BST92_04480 [Nonlabens arenilitoris]|uniref:Uncharacterized protein n=1 Tax=Nonlabens arenilitoris TaxID=1217969 RepID=A0A2S7U8D8_9FLAO|nr:hypothetical protein [Nonlabens arenilitoris]PQJ31225.1 hypothetical protein BST92_04480 [Nonlabens arenilitoris]
MKTPKIMLKFIFTLTIMTLASVCSHAQVGIGTEVPMAALDISSTDSGLLVPRIALTDLNTASPVINPNGAGLVEGTMIWNTGTGGVPLTGFYFWSNSKWNLVVSDNQPQVYFGKLLITATGTIVIEDLPFQPRAIEFTAVNRIQGFDDGGYRSASNNSNDIRMAGGQTMGYAQNYGTGIDQQVISNGANGSSINNIGTYSSDSHCIAAYFVNNNGEPIHDNGSPTGGTDDQGGLISASLVNFTDDGFTLNVDNFLAGSTTSDRTNQIVVIFKAYR